MNDGRKYVTAEAYEKALRMFRRQFRKEYRAGRQY